MVMVHRYRKTTELIWYMVDCVHKENPPKLIDGQYWTMKKI